MKYYITPLILMLIIICNFACKKKKPVVLPTVTKDSLTYQPHIADSKWTYDLFISGIKNSVSTVTRVHLDSSFNGIVYNVYYNEPENKYSFSREQAGKYYNVLATSTNKTELIVLDTTKNINETWHGGINGSDNYFYTITEKLIDYNLNGTIYKRVLKVFQERKDAGGNVTLSGNTWYAKGVGQIQTEGTIIGIPIELKLTTVDIK
jgi:hypothetical protein